MTMRSCMLRLLTIFAFCLATLPLAAQTPAPFTAEYKTVDAKGETNTGKIYFSAPRIRFDAKIKGQDSILLVDWNKFTVHILTEATKNDVYFDLSTYKEKILKQVHDTVNDPKMKPEEKAMLQKILHPDFNNVCASLPAEAGCKSGGVKTIHERSCTLWTLSKDAAKSEKADGESVSFCLDNETRLPLLIQALKDGKELGSLELTSLKPGPVEESVFATPSDYTPMDMTAMMSGMLDGMMKAIEQNKDKLKNKLAPHKSDETKPAAPAKSPAKKHTLNN